MTETSKFEFRAKPAAGNRRQIILAGLAAMLGGCASTTVNINESPLVEMAEAEVMPSKALLEDINRRTKVVVMQTVESPANRGMGLANTAEGALVAVLGAGSVEVVDRRLADRLDKELKLIEIQGSSSSGTYSGPQVADFAITVAMGTATASSRFNAASTYTDKKSGKTITIPAGYTHSSKSTLTVRVYELPSLRLVSSIPAEGSSSKSGQNVDATQAQMMPLMQTATEDAVVGRKADVLNLFSRKGYISERRAKDNKNIFRALISRQTGAKTGDEVEIISLKISVDPLSKRTITDETVVASGRISNVVGDDSSWIIVDDATAAAKVRRGDVVKVKHKKNFWDDLPIPSIIKNQL